MKRLFSSRPSSFSIEALEGRQLLSGVQVVSEAADNRGEIILGLSAAVNAATVNKNSVQVYTAGADKILGNADDTRVPASVRYSTSTHKITVEAQVTANDGYRIKLAADRLRDATNTPIDGEFNGSGVDSGNGKAGGNFEFQTKNDKSDTPTARLSTSAGTILLKLYRKLKPATVANFLSYANAANYDGIFIARYAKESDGSPFVVQQGSLAVNDDNQIVATPVNAAINSEATTNGLISNTAFTLSFALSGNSQGVTLPNSGTNQFFINLANNSFLDSQGFTVFATAANASSETTLSLIESKVTISLSSSPSNSTDVSTVPVNASYDGTLDPANDLVVFRRVAVVDKIAAL